MTSIKQNSVELVQFPFANCVGGATADGETAVAQDVNVLALVKGKERYVFLYSEDNRAETQRLLARFATNPDLSFTWYDAAVLSQKIRQESQIQAREKQKELLAKQRYNMPVND
ncbi:hypothetical protein FACS18942_02890 [Planctomycetales bacterium]|nr:hypothetical protein FACS18942_02890 [Planctomycetales bacterium]GHT35089.1 hypothetical protein FACS189427_03660 [Planctomycetales bacterium]